MSVRPGIDAISPPLRRGLGILAILLLLRALMVAQTGVIPPLPVVLAADAATAAFLLLLAPLLRPWALRVPAVALIALGYYAGGEHIATHGTLFRVAHLHHLLDAVFVAASVEGESKAWLGLHALAALPLLALLRGPRPTLGIAGTRLGLAAMVIAGYGLAMDSHTRPASNVVLGSIAQVPGAVLAQRSPEPRQTAALEGPGKGPVLQLDADGVEPEAFFERGDVAPGEGRRHNVLLILIEGLSAAYLPAVARHHGLDPAIRLPALERTLDERGFVTYRNVLSLQRQTNRGTYALLCGDYPRITTVPAKMTEAAEADQPLDCLPSMLDAAGYRTVYIQAAPLEFMHKDRFMARAGFEVVTGLSGAAGIDDRRGASASDEAPEGWGPTDERFFPAALEQLREVARGSEPWFATLLNVGTHHPFTAQGGEPDNAEEEAVLPTPEARRKVRNRAFERMVTALDQLLEALAADSLLDETSVIIASDESGAMLRQDAEPGLLDGNFGMLAIRPADARTRERLAQRDTLVTQLDVPVTIADLVGLEASGPLLGRSLLAPDEGGPRHLVFGDTYAGRTFFLRSTGRLLACDETFLRCQSWRFEPDRVIGSLEPSDDPPFLDLAARRRLAEDTSRIRPAGPGPDETAPPP
ncbi:LTA synthase family protein [Spiribacter halobius]|nr:sulfatase-like hydrolase/transferase [Spiribacter halobius]UEX76506.1 sulfatase-like hydrolase/transferase [Spiribacter halobius]